MAGYVDVGSVFSIGRSGSTFYTWMTSSGQQEETDIKNWGQVGGHSGSWVWGEGDSEGWGQEKDMVPWGYPLHQREKVIR